MSVPAPDSTTAVADVVVVDAPAGIDTLVPQSGRIAALNMPRDHARPGVLVLGDPVARHLVVVGIQVSRPRQPRPGVMDGVMSRYPELRSLLLGSVEPDRYDVSLSVGASGATAARVVTAHLRPGSIETVVGLFQNVVMLAATAQQGFRRGLLLVDSDTDRAFSIGLWEHGDLMRASEASGYLQRQIEQFAEVLAAPPTHDYYDVVFESTIPRLALRPTRYRP
jgi:hypothetical protein